ncbi:nitrate- and nitrite sensing domain-containing protein [Streptomyces caniscabiei]|uniref:histidine kinase n=1 Tax=Streptomyces caniscabiei TaxID=2746961 RepID=A0A927LE03_9ACTN|nr:nitrate- and nitrite sensing domain-containing protein [Streptomyces caniscabiei]MBD9730180.1 nitrate- and nitrite sensing domain-containing protein [Streptomyces caniscabiei]MDX3514555.1 nitrate- and nitrite sensing domain-containing protein [Streptomyces caniscabiei]MDX3723831.1 nitrate- and nitrite sensing domain-containing protein [Streptomyces caniscabiei]WEO23933.1 nitrate- and nitrite sensing domain-containing protein [Streptomyces caniscabiei]
MRRSKKGPEPSARGNFTPPPRGAAPAQVTGPEPTAAPAPSGSRLSPRNWRVPTRLNAILLIPVLVGLIMGGFQVKGSIDTWQEAKDAEKVAKIVAAAGIYAEALLNERDLSAQPLLEGDRDSDVVKDARAFTDEKADAFHAEVVGMPAGQGLERRLRLVEEAEPALEKLRQTAFTRAADPVQTEEGYVTVEHLLAEFSNELGLGTGNITAYGRTVYAVTLAKGAASLQRSIGTHLLVRPSEDERVFRQQVTAFTSYAYLENIAVQEYVSGGTEADAARLESVMAQKTEEGKKQAAEAAAKDPDYVAPPDTMLKMIQAIGSGASREDLAKQGVTYQNWMAASTLKFEGYSEVETELINRAVAEAGQIASDAQRDAYINGAIVIVALLAAFIIAGIMARQMSRSMRQLRNAAFGIAEQRLPMLVDQLSRTDPGRVDTRVAPIPINTTDEIGEVARAFDQVHREAVRLAAEQALLRGNINAIFTNLSRRNQSLIEGQLTLITDLENNEADPDQLENLFKLDHLATRMRRNGENLLVLAGEEPGRRWDQPVPLIDVLRAASSEVEQYERIELSGVPEAEIHGRAVTDLVHLLAELLENATTFSSPQTKVRVTATRLPDGRVMIEIHDKGIGLTAEDFADINHKLANPPTVDAAISQRMGLFVVGRLSDRHGVRVQLRPSGEQAGTTSLVMLPDVITHGGGGEQQQPGADQFTVSQIIPEQQHAFQQPGLAPMRTAAELGFDDSRYEVPDDIRDLDPVGRSLMREERRAALESQAHQNPQLPAGEAPRYGDDFQAPEPSYDNGATAYADPQRSYDQQTAYEEPQQPSYDEAYFGQGNGVANGNGHLPGGNDAFTATGGYPEPAYAEPVQEDHAAAAANAPETYTGFEEPSYQDDWPQQQDYQSSYRSEYAPEPESAQAADVTEPDRVGFDRPGPTPSAGHALTDAGLPRRGSTASAGGTSAGAVNGRQEVAQDQPTAGGPNGDWRSANDERWQQASQLKKPKAGGVTSSGLPRRVPKANLVEGAATTTPQGGPQISRAPEDVRGRLSNLRRGVQRGRSASSETNGQGFGSDSTYNQER